MHRWTMNRRLNRVHVGGCLEAFIIHTFIHDFTAPAALWNSVYTRLTPFIQGAFRLWSSSIDGFTFHAHTFISLQKVILIQQVANSVSVRVNTRTLSVVDSCRNSKCVALPLCQSMGTIRYYLLPEQKSSLYAGKKIKKRAHTLFPNVPRVMRAFRVWAFATKVLHIFELPHVALTCWDGSRKDEYICWPSLISRSEYGTMFSATADGVRFRATKRSKLRLILYGFIWQYVTNPKAVGWIRELHGSEFRVLRSLWKAQARGTRWRRGGACMRQCRKCTFLILNSQHHSYTSHFIHVAGLLSQSAICDTCCKFLREHNILFLCPFHNRFLSFVFCPMCFFCWL